MQNRKPCFKAGEMKLYYNACQKALFWVCSQLQLHREDVHHMRWLKGWPKRRLSCEIVECEELFSCNAEISPQQEKQGGWGGNYLPSRWVLKRNKSVHGFAHEALHGAVGHVLDAARANEIQRGWQF